MAQQKNAHVPKFGNWDNDGNVPYTLYFENARKGKVAGGKMINPNDPVENPEGFSSVAAPSPSRAPPAPSHHERGPSDEPPPPRYAGSPYHRHGAGGETPARRGGRTSGGGYSVEQSPSPSPLHPYSQSRPDYSDSGSSYGGLVPNSVDRSRAKGGGGPLGNETPTRGSAVPKFGDWESNPASADGYTHIFNKVREGKQTQTAKPQGFGGNVSKQHDDDYASTKCSCFGWCK